MYGSSTQVVCCSADGHPHKQHACGHAATLTGAQSHPHWPGGHGSEASKQAWWPVKGPEAGKLSSRRACRGHPRGSSPGAGGYGMHKVNLLRKSSGGRVGIPGLSSAGRTTIHPSVAQRGENSEDLPAGASRRHHQAPINQTTGMGQKKSSSGSCLARQPVHEQVA